MTIDNTTIRPNKFRVCHIHCHFYCRSLHWITAGSDASVCPEAEVTPASVFGALAPRMESSRSDARRSPFIMIDCNLFSFCLQVSRINYDVCFARKTATASPIDVGDGRVSGATRGSLLKIL